jgi:hypothetical protein
LLGRIPRRGVGCAGSFSASPSANPVGRRERFANGCNPLATCFCSLMILRPSLRRLRRLVSCRVGKQGIAKLGQEGQGGRRRGQAGVVERQAPWKRRYGRHPGVGGGPTPQVGPPPAAGVVSGVRRQLMRMFLPFVTPWLKRPCLGESDDERSHTMFTKLPNRGDRSGASFARCTPTEDCLARPPVSQTARRDDRLATRPGGVLGQTTT